MPGPGRWQDNPRYFLEAGYVTETYTYDGLGRLDTTEQTLERRESVMGGALTITTQQVVTSERGYDDASRQRSEVTRTLHEGGITTRLQTSVYNGDGHLTRQTAQRSASTSPTAQVDPTSSIMESVVMFGVDATGVRRSYTMDVYNASGDPAYTSTYTHSFRLTDTYQESGQSVTSTGTGAPQAGQVVRQFNANDELVGWLDSKDANRNRFFANNAQGQALTVVQGEVGDDVPLAAE